ncbi:cytochrome P450 [Actinomadura livida]|uniref:Cytochrome P450 n=1 Tax=Actinomadura livida TaxID=79909 RepID=A0A7W7IFC9_9ACTN|nr:MULTISPECIES: cytochrome P450 [Actinomadura]MBB4776094.1 cytochrome P450 [Actinomadura catellatispora]GGU15540.1 cytochrome P450 [Actinomadura livida]
MVADPTPQTCPVGDYTSYGTGPALTFFQRMDAYQDGARPVMRSEEANGYWVFTDHEAIHDGLQRTDLWSSSAIIPTDPNPPFRLIPLMLDPPEHTPWRVLLRGYFSPKRVRSMADEQRRLAGEIIDGLAARGECDFVDAVARVFPATIFLQIMGMPPAKLPEFLEWEGMILHSGTDRDRVAAGTGLVIEYFAGLIAERRAAPDPDATDIVNSALSWEIDGEPVSDADLLNCMLLLFMAGLDTVSSQSSYMFLHLATHPADRKRVTDDPDLIPIVVEEILRAYPIVQTARKAVKDTEFHGCPVKAGDMAVFPLSAAGRDETVHPGARRVNLDRDSTKHISFGGGPHRCLGSHLARQELAVLLEEWHRRIPDYELAERPTEHSGGVWALDDLKLRWNA